MHCETDYRIFNLFVVKITFICSNLAIMKSFYIILYQQQTLNCFRCCALNQNSGTCDVEFENSKPTNRVRVLLPIYENFVTQNVETAVVMKSHFAMFNNCS